MDPASGMRSQTNRNVQNLQMKGDLNQRQFRAKNSIGTQNENKNSNNVSCTQASAHKDHNGELSSQEKSSKKVEKLTIIHFKIIEQFIDSQGKVLKEQVVKDEEIVRSSGKISLSDLNEELPLSKKTQNLRQKSQKSETKHLLGAWSTTKSSTTTLSSRSSEKTKPDTSFKTNEKTHPISDTGDLKISETEEDRRETASALLSLQVDTNLKSSLLTNSSGASKTSQVTYFYII